MHYDNVLCYGYANLTSKSDWDKIRASNFIHNVIILAWRKCGTPTIHNGSSNWTGTVE